MKKTSAAKLEWKQYNIFMNCIWVTGSQGFLGSEFCRIVRGKFPGCMVVCIVHSLLPGCESSEFQGFECLDLTDFPKVKEVFAKFPPDAIFHLAAASDANWCEENPEASHKINVSSTVFLGELCASRKIPLIFSSTDLIFDGRTGNYSETAIPNPVSLYGRQKVLAEIETRKIHPDGFSVCRIPLMYGPPGASGKNPLHGLIQGFMENKPIKLFIDEFRTPASTRAVSEGLLLTLKERPSVIHLGGKERVSRFEFGIRLARWLGKPVDTIMKCSQNEIPMAAERPADVSLSSGFAFSLGYSPGRLEEEWEGCSFFRKLKPHARIT